MLRDVQRGQAGRGTAASRALRHQLLLETCNYASSGLQCSLTGKEWLAGLFMTSWHVSCHYVRLHRRYVIVRADRRPQKPVVTGRGPNGTTIEIVHQ